MWIRTSLRDEGVRIKPHSHRAIRAVLPSTKGRWNTASLPYGKRRWGGSGGNQFVVSNNSPTTASGPYAHASQKVPKGGSRTVPRGDGGLRRGQGAARGWGRVRRRGGCGEETLWRADDVRPQARHCTALHDTCLTLRYATLHRAIHYAMLPARVAGPNALHRRALCTYALVNVCNVVRAGRVGVSHVVEPRHPPAPVSADAAPQCATLQPILETNGSFLKQK